MYNNSRNGGSSSRGNSDSRNNREDRPVRKNSSRDFLEKSSSDVAKGISREGLSSRNSSREDSRGNYNRAPREDRGDSSERNYNRVERPARESQDSENRTPRPSSNREGGNSYGNSRNDRPQRSYSSDRDSSSDRSSGGYRGDSSRSPSRGPSRGTSSRGGSSSRGSSSRGGFQSRGRRSSGGSQRIDYALFVRKASPVAQMEYKPKHKFSDFKVHDSLKKNIAAKKYDIPTPIQDQTIPLLLEGRDVVGIANTGTGKTAAFLIPLIDKVIKDKSQKILIMTPTRELANQIQDEFREFAKGLGIYSVTVIGGESISKQIYALNKHTHFVIGTPGRVKDLMNRGNLKLHDVGNIVLDEVDRMVDMGFIDDMTDILSELPEERHSLFFSATISKGIEQQVLSFLKNPVTVSVKTQATADNVEQDIVKIERGGDKVEMLHDILIKEESKKVLVFVKTKREADRLDRELYERGFQTVSLHGDKSQYQRQKSLDKFREGRADILVATDVAARGLDIPNVSHVINYDLPATYEDYVHRIGRTGRAHNKGKALTFVS